MSDHDDAHLVASLDGTLLRYGSRREFWADPDRATAAGAQTLVAAEGLWSQLMETERETVSTAALAAGGDIILRAFADEAAQRGLLPLARQLYEARVFDCEEPVQMCTIAHNLLIRSGTADIPLCAGDFSGSWYQIGVEALTIPYYPDSTRPAPKAPVMPELAWLATRAFGLAWLSISPTAIGNLSWDDAWLGLFTLEGLRGALGEVDDLDGLVLTLALGEIWCEVVREHFGEDLVAAFEARQAEHLAYLQGRQGGKFRAAIEFPVRKLAGPTPVNYELARIQDQLEQLKLEQQRQSAMQRAGFQAVFGLAGTSVSVENLLRSWETMILEIATTASLIQQEIRDSQLDDVRRFLVEEWRRTHPARELEALDAEAQELVGAGAWARLRDESREDIRAFTLLGKEPSAERWTRLRILCGCIAFERELRAALVRCGVPRGEVEVVVEKLLYRAKELQRPRLGNIASDALKAELPRSRNAAAHGDAVGAEDLRRVEAALFAHGGEHGLLGLVATCEPTP